LCLALAAGLLWCVGILTVSIFCKVHGTKFDIDLSEGEFDEYDESGGCPVSLSKLQSTFKVVNKHSLPKLADMVHLSVKTILESVISRLLTYLYMMNSQVKKQGFHGKTRYV
jgi:hypothetical protein